MSAISAAAARVEREPTDAQKEAGNYRKGHFRWEGLDIAIENPAGSFRRGKDTDGKEWAVRLPVHYGYVKGTMGADGDAVDVFINPKPERGLIFVIDQVDPHTGEFDEHKCLMGFGQQIDAILAYADSYSDGKGRNRIGAISALPLPAFKAWLASRSTRKPLAYDPKRVALKKWDESQVRRDEIGRFANKLGYAAGSAGIGAVIGGAVHGLATQGWKGNLTGRGALIGAGVGLATSVALQTKRHIQYGPDLEGGVPKTARIRQVLVGHGEKFDRERAVVTTAAGRVLADRVGGDSSVAAFGPVQTPVVAARMAVKAPFRTYHNHPGAGRAFNVISPADLNATLHSAKYGARDVVFTATGSSYRARGAVDLPERDVEKIVRAYASSLRLPKSPSGVVDEALRFMSKFPEGGGDAISQARAHGALLGLADRGLISYNFRLSPFDKERAEHLKRNIAEARKAMAGRAGLPSRRKFHTIDAAGDVEAAKIVPRPMIKVDGGLAKAAPSLLSIAERIEDDLATRIGRALAWLAGKPAEAVAEALEDGRPTDDIVDALPTDSIEFRLDREMKPLDQAFDGGRQAGDAALPAASGGRRIEVDFDQRNRFVNERLSAYKLSLIQQITSDQRETVRRILLDGLDAGAPPAEIARSVREQIGLTDNQARHVANYRAELENLDGGALDRSLRDRRYDRTVARAIADQKDLTPAQIDAMVDAYHRRYIAYRAMTIARTEALRAVNTGQRASIEAASAGGQLEGMVLEKRWIATKDDRTRDSHRDLDGKVVIGLDTPFITQSGAAIRWPHDVEAPADETIRCRCTLSFRLVPRG